MRILTRLILLLAGFGLPSFAQTSPRPAGGDTDLTQQQIRTIIARERANRKELPKPFPKYRSTVKKHGNFYTYIEYGIPEAPEYSMIFKLNRNGVIVDVITAGDLEKTPLPCPEKVFTEAQLAEIVKSERERRNDLPAPFSKVRTRVARSRCLYLYFEYAVPEVRGKYQVFTIDPFGEIMEFSRSEAY